MLCDVETYPPWQHDLRDTMTAATRTKTARKMSILSRPRPGEFLIEIVDAREVSIYYVTPVVPFSGVGRAWIFQGIGHKSGSRYECSLIGDGQDGGFCECPARVECCRHKACLLKLQELGKL